MTVRIPVEEGELTHREMEVLDLLSYGHSERDVAGKLGVTYYTVHFHAKHIRQKLGAHTTHACVAKAFMDGLIW